MFLHRKKNKEISELLQVLKYIKVPQEVFDEGWRAFRQELQKLSTSSELFTQDELRDMPAPIYKHAGVIRFVFSHVAASVAIAVIVFGGLAITVVASKDSLPNNPLYTVKLALERTQLVFSFSDKAKALTHTIHLNKRVREVNELLTQVKEKPEPKSSQRVIKAIEAAQEQAVVVKAQLAQLNPGEEQAEDIQELADAAEELVSYSVATAGPLKEIPAELKGEIESVAAELASALDEVKQVADEKTELLTAVGGSDAAIESATSTDELLDAKASDLATSTDEALLAEDSASSTDEILDETATSSDEVLPDEEEVNLTTPEVLLEDEVEPEISEANIKAIE